MNTFWTNTIWFIILGISTVVEVLAFIKKSNQRKFTFAFYCTVAGITFSIEALICIFLKSYEYYPKIILNSQYNDTIMGNHFSQFSISATLLLVAVYDLKFIWRVVAAAAYGLIEEAFLVLGVYKHYWYSTWFTFIGVIVLCFIVQKLYRKHRESLSARMRYIYVLFALFTLYVPTVIYLFRVFGKLEYIAQIVKDPYSNNMILVFIHLAVMSNLVMLLYLRKVALKWHLLAVVLLYAGYYGAMKLNVIFVAPGWFWVISSVSIAAMYFYVILLNYLYREIPLPGSEPVKREISGV